MVISSPRKRNRLPDYDYSAPGWYYITVCTYKLHCWFGKIEDGKMQLNKIGKIVEQCWEKTPKHFNRIELDEYIVMPNHVHGIIIINSNDVGNADLRSLQKNDRTKMLLSKVIHGFKSTVTRKIRKQLNEYAFAWQRSFYDHIIRNEKSLYKIRNYIHNNPIRWYVDKNNPLNLP